MQSVNDIRRESTAWRPGSVVSGCGCYQAGVIIGWPWLNSFCLYKHWLPEVGVDLSCAMKCFVNGVHCKLSNSVWAMCRQALCPACLGNVRAITFSLKKSLSRKYSWPPQKISCIRFQNRKWCSSLGACGWVASGGSQTTVAASLLR